MNAKALSIVRYQNDIYTEHNMKTVCRAAVAQWKERLTRNGYTRVQISKGAYVVFLILHTLTFRVWRNLYLVLVFEYSMQNLFKYLNYSNTKFILHYLYLKN